jgi:hypothetical protein
MAATTKLHHHHEPDAMMEIDPVDDGPRGNPEPPIAAVPSLSPMSFYDASITTASLVPPVANAAEANAALEMLKHNNGDYSQRVLASHQFDSIARIIGPERTRSVRQ